MSMDSPLDRPQSHRRFVLVVLLFIATRSIALFLPPLGSDVPVYASYAVEFQAARQMGISLFAFCNLPAEVKQKAVKKLSQDITAWPGNLFEYPPLALVPMILPRWACAGFRGETRPGDCTLAKYWIAFRLQMAAVDVLLFLLLAGLLRRVFPAETSRDRANRLAVYTLGGFLVCQLIYDRLDLLFAALLTLALALLVTQARRWPAWSVLALSIGFKLVSVFLLPIWAIASLTAGPAPEKGSVPAVLGKIAKLAAYALVIAALSAACFLPVLWSGSWQGLSFLRYHSQRGIQIESTWSILLYAVALWKGPLELSRDPHGSADVVNPTLAGLAQVSVAITVLAVAILSLAYFFRATRAGRDAAVPPATVGQTTAALTIRTTVACLLAMMCASKVFSPQYLLWALPLICLMPGTERQRRAMFVLFLGLCLLTSLIYPALFARMLQGFAPGGRPGWLACLGVAAVVLRNAGLVVLLVLVLRASCTARQS
jgi:hypothetical protein